jgi:hypothetical protein
MWKQHLAMLTFVVGSAFGLIHLTRVERVDAGPSSPSLSERQSNSVKKSALAIDAEFVQYWQDEGLEVAEPATEMLVIRRLSLGLAGTLPSLEEIRALEKMPKDQRVDWWLDRLFSDRRYADYVAERFARVYVGTENGPFLMFRRRRFTHWLSDRLHQNESYATIVRDLISGRGTWTSNPAVNFITVTFDQEKDRLDPIRLAGRTARAFLGVRIDCVQCHDDFLGTVELGEPGARRDGVQQDFHQLAAFYSGTRVSAAGVRDATDPYKVQLLGDEDETRLLPAVPFHRDLLPAKGPRRQRLATWVTDPKNRPFARVTVNRVWALMFGRPLVEPIDSIPLHDELPPGMELLATDFVENGFDLQRLIRVIAATRVFGLDSRAGFEILSRHEAGWAVFPLTRLRPEQVAGAVTQACSISTLDADAHVISQMMKFFQTNEFVQRYGDLGEDEFDDRGITIPQRLLLMNGNLVHKRTGDNLLFNASSQIGAFAGNDRNAIKAAYLACFTRPPTATESALFKGHLHETQGGRRKQVLADLFWVLLNSTEFSWNH